MNAKYSSAARRKYNTAMRVLVTGGCGMLGSDVCREFLNNGDEVLPVSTRDFDIADPDRTRKFIQDYAPQLVIHCAAYTDVDGCERDPEKAFRVNAYGGGNVAIACARTRARLVAISSDFVFDGKKGSPYIENDQTNPLGVYGKSKRDGEKLVRENCEAHYIVRTSWLYGVHGKCFPSTMLKLSETRDEISVVSDQIGSPTFTADLAGAIVRLTAGFEFGTYHISNSGETSWAGFAEAIFEEADGKHVRVNPIRSDEWPSPTKRPAYSALKSEHIKRGLRPWREALKQYFIDLKKEESRGNSPQS